MSVADICEVEQRNELIRDSGENRSGSIEEDGVSTRMERGPLTTLLWVFFARLWSQWSE
jgi:hypothetical protein